MSLRFAVRVPLIACLFAVLAAPLARASAPTAIYVYPSRVDFFPDQANATRVAIHGAFFFYQNGGAYSKPACGYMFFQCQPGMETMCRMQWDEINKAIGGQTCEGFGAMNMMTTATLRTEGTPLGNPDVYDIAMGVSPGFFVSGQCQPAQQLSCPGAATKPDMAMAAPVDMAQAPADLAMQQTPADMGAAANPDLTQPGTTPKPSGCGSCAAGGRPAQPGNGNLALLSALFSFGMLLRLRRRRA